jgi:hypothetical protein
MKDLLEVSSGMILLEMVEDCMARISGNRSRLSKLVRNYLQN